MKITTNYTLAFLLVFAGTAASAQLNLRLPNSLRPAVEKVLSSYPQHFETIRGDSIGVALNITTFNSTVKPEGAMECTLIKYGTNDIPDYTWQAVMYQSDDFEAAAKKYSTYYQQLKNMMFRTSAGNFKMEGEYEQPNETKNFYSTIFSPNTEDPAISRLRLEILLEGDMTAWTLRILVYDRVHDDKEGNMVNGK